MFKSAIRRTLRPALWDLQQSVQRMESTLARQAAALSAGNQGSVWRGGADGHAINAAGHHDPAGTSKYSDELKYWIAACGGQDPAHGARFIEVFTQWQVTRLGELADRLSLDRGEAMDAWCRTRDVVEIGGGPIPCCAFRSFRSAVAVDPLVDGYLTAGLVPAAVRERPIVHLSACGEQIPLPGGSADLVIVENCLDHTDQPARVVSEIHRVLRPGGLLWILVDLMEYSDHMHPSPMSAAKLDALLLPKGLVYIYKQAWEGASHPMAKHQLRALARKV